MSQKPFILGLWLFSSACQGSFSSAEVDSETRELTLEDGTAGLVGVIEIRNSEERDSSAIEVHAVFRDSAEQPTSRCITRAIGISGCYSESCAPYRDGTSVGPLSLELLPNAALPGKSWSVTPNPSGRYLQRTGTSRASGRELQLVADDGAGRSLAVLASLPTLPDLSGASFRSDGVIEGVRGGMPSAIEFSRPAVDGTTMICPVTVVKGKPTISQVVAASVGRILYLVRPIAETSATYAEEGVDVVVKTVTYGAKSETARP